MSRKIHDMRRTRTKIIRFLTVGLGNTLVDFTVFWLLSGLPVLLANLLSWSAAICFSYALNATWTFERGRSHHQALPRFLMGGAVVSLGVSSLSLGVLTGWVGVWPAKIIGTVLAAVLNFMVALWSIEARGKGS